jgi:hypothetical protein
MRLCRLPLLVSGLNSTPLISFYFSFWHKRRVCSGAWDLLCFIEHLCVTSMLKFILAVMLVLIGESRMHAHPQYNLDLHSTTNIYMLNGVV